MSAKKTVLQPTVVAKRALEKVKRHSITETSQLAALIMIAGKNGSLRHIFGG
jgi:hypothetical protein